ncbi:MULTISPECIES: phytanoyl-CoA dioxygenase family protein [Streptomyces]|uniref:Phytanoyl-CoA dioxygenase n=2 Tax=Streptomyces TaxID=1883 RepID=M3DI33_STREZ|nr:MULTISPECIES: phytanoyl-CoA dioxygenase family protein [Streptomyces]EMF29610.1 Phytanoyl-CoA dioxygenase [Streptomyces gancidicus BKS 13-15]MCI4145428.1 phytanoyl-CoA dioxygenase family protein [Streptomyces sp. MMS20-AI2-20]GGQ27345.1 phytanoyl-CoA dioxygenase [Streptomyces gancidicus]
MSPHTHPGVTQDALDVDVTADVEALYEDGITARKGAFTPEWADRLREDIEAAFDEARSRLGGAVGRGPHRYYVEIHPEQLRGFVDLADHPWVRSVCTAVLGPDYRIVEVGFDVPLEGAVNQPWHRDFPMPEETRAERRLTSLAFNVTAVDTEEDMGPFEIAPGTQWDDSPEFAHGMFPPRSHYPRYEERAVRKYPRRGDISARSALTIHRGTRNHSATSRPVLVLGVDGPEATNGERHDTAVTRAYWDSLPERVRRHLDCEVVDELRPVTQKHTIEGLVMGDA